MLTKGWTDMTKFCESA